jgi:hypothetical protein
MLYFETRPEPETKGKLRELTLLCTLAAVGIMITLGAIWLGLEIGGVIP